MGTLIVTPYVLPYDLPVLAITAVFLIRAGLCTGFVAGARSVILCLTPLPLSQFWLPLPIGTVMEATLMAIIIVQVRNVEMPISAIVSSDGEARS